MRQPAWRLTAAEEHLHSVFDVPKIHSRKRFYRDWPSVRSRHREWRRLIQDVPLLLLDSDHGWPPITIVPATPCRANHPTARQGCGSQWELGSGSRTSPSGVGEVAWHHHDDFPRRALRGRREFSEELAVTSRARGIFNCKSHRLPRSAGISNENRAELQGRREFQMKLAPTSKVGTIF